MRRARGLSGLTPLFLVLSAACAGGKGAADAAVKAADDAVASLPADAAKIMPEALAPITQTVQTAKDQVAKGDYQQAVTTAKDVPAQVQALAAQLPAKRTELAAEMDTLSVAMPRNLAAMKTKLDALAKTKKLPQGLDAQKLQAAKDTYTAAMTEWGNIMAAFKSGDLASAHTRALDLKARVSQSLVALGLASDDKAWSNATPAPQ